MKHSKYFRDYYLLILVFLIACKKDIKNPVSGSYKGTVLHKTYRHPDVVNAVKDTLYNDVTIQVTESGMNTPNDAKLDFRFSQGFGWFPPINTLPVKNNQINHYSTSRGAISSSQWKGKFAQDSLQLLFRYDDHHVFVNEFTIKAQKQ